MTRIFKLADHTVQMFLCSLTRCHYNTGVAGADLRLRLHDGNEEIPQNHFEVLARIDFLVLESSG